MHIERLIINTLYMYNNSIASLVLYLWLYIGVIILANIISLRSNMNASSFITFGTYMLRQNGIRFYTDTRPKEKYSIRIEL